MFEAGDDDAPESDDHPVVEVEVTASLEGLRHGVEVLKTDLGPNVFKLPIGQFLFITNDTQR